MPDKSPVEPETGHSRQHLKLGGRSMKTKNIRSATPRGFAQAVFNANNSSMQDLQYNRRLYDACVIPNKITDIKKTSIENSSPTMPIIDILGFKKINIIRK